MASGENINILVLDTEVYSNTGGQMSKSTPLAATAQFAAGGKRTPKKNLGLIVATYGSVYVAQIAFGASPAQTVKALTEAEAHDGPSIVICYSTCVAHGINMTKGIEEQKKAVSCGHWPLYRYNPALESEGKSPLVIDSKKPSLDVEEYAYSENRYRALKAKDPELAARLMEQLKSDISRRWNYLSHLASWTPGEEESAE
jgi:pyruvate-ferredoxin/flavodoxin oxidoreductase